MRRTATTVPLFLLALLSASSCGSGNGAYLHEDSFAALSGRERAAKERIQHWVARAQYLLDLPSLPADQQDRLRAAIQDTRAALAHYHEQRAQGGTRGVIMAPLKVAAAGLLADDLTVAGIGNDIALIPIALAALATYVVTDAAASADALGASWNQLMSEVRALSTTTVAAAMAVKLTDADCLEIQVECLENVWQPDWNREKFGPKKECRECVAICKDEGTWPNEKCPRIWQRYRP